MQRTFDATEAGRINALGLSRPRKLAKLPRRLDGVPGVAGSDSASMGKVFARISRGGMKSTGVEGVEISRFIGRAGVAGGSSSGSARRASMPSRWKQTCDRRAESCAEILFLDRVCKKASRSNLSSEGFGSSAAD